MRALANWTIVLLASIGSAAAQPAGPYVTGHAGATGGDGGGALITGGSAGYMSPRRLAFELEISVSPDVDFPAPPFSILSVFPAPGFQRRRPPAVAADQRRRDAGQRRKAAGGDHRRWRRRERPPHDHLRLPRSPSGFFEPAAVTDTAVPVQLDGDEHGNGDEPQRRRYRRLRTDEAPARGRRRPLHARVPVRPDEGSPRDRAGAVAILIGS